MEFTGLTSASHMSLQEAGYGSEEGQLGSEISGAVSGVTTPGASRLQASQSQQRSTTMQRLQVVPRKNKPVANSTQKRHAKTQCNPTNATWIRIAHGTMFLVVSLASSACLPTNLALGMWKYLRMMTYPVADLNEHKLVDEQKLNESLRLA